MIGSKVSKSQAAAAAAVDVVGASVRETLAGACCSDEGDTNLASDVLCRGSSATALFFGLPRGFLGDAVPFDLVPLSSDPADESFGGLPRLFFTLPKSGPSLSKFFEDFVIAEIFGGNDCKAMRLLLFQHVSKSGISSPRLLIGLNPNAAAALLSSLVSSES